MVKDLYKNTYSINNNRVNEDDDNRGGENLHISSSAGPIIDSLLSILPFDNEKLMRLYLDINNQQQRQQPSLKLDDIDEVVHSFRCAIRTFSGKKKRKKKKKEGKKKGLS